MHNESKQHHLCGDEITLDCTVTWGQDDREDTKIEDRGALTSSSFCREQWIRIYQTKMILDTTNHWIVLVLIMLFSDLIWKLFFPQPSLIAVKRVQFNDSHSDKNIYGKLQLNLCPNGMMTDHKKKDNFRIHVTLTRQVRPTARSVRKLAQTKTMQFFEYWNLSRFAKYNLLNINSNSWTSYAMNILKDIIS